MHYNEENPGHLVKNILENIEPGLEGSYEFTKVKNKTGYTGVHYIIVPLPVDECYFKTKLHNGFELQVRTIAQHAWSELQHRAVYKGISAACKINKMRLQFEVLADAVDSLDRRLDKISTQTIMTASRQAPIDDADDFIETIKQKISYYEEERIKEDDRREKGNAFIKENAEQFEAINEKTYQYRLQVCEFYLKSCLFKKARDAYNKYVMADDSRKEYPWALLRLIEACDALAEEECVQENLDNLTSILTNREMTIDDVALVMTASFFSWKYKHLQQAITLGDMLWNFDGDISEIDQHKAYINSCYYRVDLLRKNKKEQNLLYRAQQKLINEIEKLYAMATSVQNNHEIEVDPDQLDCMAYFEYIFGEIEMENNNYDRAIKHSEQAKIFIEKCFSDWNRIQVPTIEDQLWSKHRLQIMAQTSHIKRLSES